MTDTPSIFGLIVASRAIQTNFVQTGENEFVIEIPDADSVNHLCVFLTGIQPFPDGFGGSIYVRLPNEQGLSDWHYLGFIANVKPSAMFKIAQLAHHKSNASDDIFSASANFAIGSVIVGVIVEPLDVIQQKVAAEGTATSNQSTMNRFAETMTTNLINYLGSKVVSLPNPMNPTITNEFIPAKAVNDWFTNRYINRLHRLISKMTVLSRIASLTGRSIVRSVSTKPPTMLFAMKTMKPSFGVSTLHTSSVLGQSSVHHELIGALENEIQAEKNLEKENLGGSVQPSIPGFNITVNQAEVRLTKTFQNEKILVVFNVNHSVDVEEDESDADSAPLPIALPPFNIEITKQNERLCFSMSLVETNESGQFDFRVDEFYVAPATKDGNEEVEDSVYSSSGRYIDPSLHEVLFVRYLEERGFTQDFCRQLSDLATYVEHNCYIGLLAKIKDFVAKN
ncbi:Conserved regulator of innate immunity protein 3 [Aphelenchoides besseyi]|nr:Conserved regulator of innate immunity protein 3 [Aphelenchoides besseyi]KAI6200194.1 Conserved regulator of innate immunity protein 3 [Aphelenchoides besseyi]